MTEKWVVLQIEHHNKAIEQIPDDIYTAYLLPDDTRRCPS